MTTEFDEKSFYLHSDDSYYWTPQAWAEFKAVKEERDKLIEENKRFRSALEKITLLDDSLMGNCRRIADKAIGERAGE
jgi:hypothetical protein